MLIDTHAHLDFPDFANDLEDVLRRAEEADVRRIITIGTSIESSRRAIELAEKYRSVYAAVGVHPSHAEEAEEDVITPLRELAKNPRVVAIGETGFDYHHLASEKVAKEDQVQVMTALRSETDEEIEAQIRDGAFKSKQVEFVPAATRSGGRAWAQRRDSSTRRVGRHARRYCALIRASCALFFIASAAPLTRRMKLSRLTISFRLRELLLSKTAQPCNRSRQKFPSGNLWSRPIVHFWRLRLFAESGANRRRRASSPKRSL